MPKKCFFFLRKMQARLWRGVCLSVRNNYFMGVTEQCIWRPTITHYSLISHCIYLLYVHGCCMTPSSGELGSFLTLYSRTNNKLETNVLNNYIIFRLETNSSVVELQGSFHICFSHNFFLRVYVCAQTFCSMHMTSRSRRIDGFHPVRIRYIFFKQAITRS